MSISNHPPDHDWIFMAGCVTNDLLTRTYKKEIDDKMYFLVQRVKHREKETLYYGTSQMKAWEAYNDSAK